MKKHNKSKVKGDSGQKSMKFPPKRRKIQPADSSNEFNKKVPKENVGNSLGENKDYTVHKNFSNHKIEKRLLIKPGVKWFEQRLSEPDEKNCASNDVIQSLKSEARKIFLDESLQYQRFLEKRKEKADFIWMKTILRTGTLSDKISAHTLLIQDSSIYNVNSIQFLIDMITPKGKRECLMTIDCVKDLFLSELLVPSKKLKAFNQHPLDKLDKLTSGNIFARRKRLLLWYFEDHLKEIYAKFVHNLEAVSRDTVDKTKQRSVSVMYELLKHNPEQEQFLLEHLVNKIGDPIPKVGSHVVLLLGHLVSSHPTMVSVVVQEVERVLFRTNVAERAKYYCLCFLNQLIFNHEDSHIASHVITMYFGLFKMCIKKGEINTKMMSALLTGVSRAYPYAKLESNVFMEQIDAIFRLVHMVSFNISIQALMLIFQVLDSKDSVSDRFYCTLYRKIMDPALFNSSRQSLLINLLYRALKKDVAVVRVKAFVKRLLQVSLNLVPTMQCSILMLISELAKTHTGLLETKQTAVLYSDSDSEEHYDDVMDADSSTQDRKVSVNIKEENTLQSTVISSWVHRDNRNLKKVKHTYDVHCRSPLHAGAEYSNMWELCFLRDSFHPSVSLFAHQVINSKDVNYSGDPLQDFSLIHFLDRFVYRNPKKVPKSVKADVHRKVFGRRIRSAAEQNAIPITSEAYISQNEERIPVEERFIYKYLKQRSATGKRKSKDDSDVESVNSDEFESLLNNIHTEDENKDALNFAKELGMRKNKRVEDDAMEDVESFESDNEDDQDFDDDEEFQDAFKDFESDMEDLDDNNAEFSATDFIDDEVKVGKHKKKNRMKLNTGDVFASADEFATLLEDNTGIDATSEAFVNYDKSAAKQLAWEKRRDQYVKGTDWKSRKRTKKFRNRNVKRKSNVK